MINKALIWISAILGAVALFLRGSLAKEKAERKQEELDRAKRLYAGSEKATEALIRGMEDEAKPIRRGYFKRKSK